MPNVPAGIVLRANPEVPGVPNEFVINNPVAASLALSTGKITDSKIALTLSMQISTSEYHDVTFPEPSDPPSKKAIYAKLLSTDFSKVGLNGNVAIKAVGTEGLPGSFDLVFTVRINDGKIGGGAGPIPAKKKAAKKKR